MKVWVYESRRGEVMLFSEDKRHLARMFQDEDNGGTVEQIRDNDSGLEIDGDPDSGDFSIDDGGSINLVEVI